MSQIDNITKIEHINSHFMENIFKFFYIYKQEKQMKRGRASKYQIRIGKVNLKQEVERIVKTFRKEKIQFIQIYIEFATINERSVSLMTMMMKPSSKKVYMKSTCRFI